MVLDSEAVVMGILNATPDSFSDGGEYDTINSAILRAVQMRNDGARIIDIGGESTRPGAVPVKKEEELSRVLPVIQELRKMPDFDEIFISVDTSKAAVAHDAIQAGADIVNDVTGCTGDPEMIRVCNEHGVGVVVMHMQGTPETMQKNPSYNDVLDELKTFFVERYRTLTEAGIEPEKICFDPGIGFGKTDEHNLQLLRNLGEVCIEKRPVLLGVSRKSLFGRLLGIDAPQERDAATIALTSLARNNGCMLHRVHDVKGNYDAIRMTEQWMKQEFDKIR